jgi:hypothetical protein
VFLIGGGLFPRTAIALRRILPSAEIVIADAVAAHLDVARRFLQADAGGRVTFVERHCSAHDASTADLVVVPLAFRGDRSAFYQAASGHAVIVHDWIWRPRGTATVVVSWLLLKRLNFVSPRDHRHGQAQAAVSVSSPTSWPTSAPLS